MIVKVYVEGLQLITIYRFKYSVNLCKILKWRFASFLSLMHKSYTVILVNIRQMAYWQRLALSIHFNSKDLLYHLVKFLDIIGRDRRFLAVPNGHHQPSTTMFKFSSREQM